MITKRVPLEAAAERPHAVADERAGGRGNRGRGGGPGRLKRFGARGFCLFAVLPLIAIAQTPAPQGADEKPSAPLKVAPRAYFTAHCQRCHGVDGINFVPGFAKEPPDKLKADIVRMADGPGGAPLKPEDVEVQIAYHRLISAQKPFVAWTEREGLTLKGEVAEGADLKASVGKLTVDDDGVWTLVLPSEADLKTLRLTATLDKATTEFVPSESPFAKLKEEKAPVKT